jgi:hypothetical protein
VLTDDVRRFVADNPAGVTGSDACAHIMRLRGHADERRVREALDGMADRGEIRRWRLQKKGRAIPVYAPVAEGDAAIRKGPREFVQRSLDAFAGRGPRA